MSKGVTSTAGQVAALKAENERLALHLQMAVHGLRLISTYTKASDARNTAQAILSGLNLGGIEGMGEAI